MYSKILIATDGSDHAKHALTSAIESAVKWGAELIILTVVPPLSPQVYASEISGDRITRLEDELTEYHKNILSEASDTVKKNNPTVSFSTRLEKGHPDSLIVEVAREEDVDLIVMGNRGLGGISSWMLGSTSRHVIETCTKPILIVK